MLPTSSSRYQQHPDHSLLIRSVAYTDVGIYTCQAYNGIGSMAVFAISVRFTHSSDLNDPLDLHTEHDGFHAYGKEVGGDKQNEKQLDYSEPTSPIPPEGAVSYSSKNYIPSVSTSLPPSPTVYKAKIIGGPIFNVRSGDTLNLTCLVIQGSSVTPSYISWYHNGNIVNNDLERGFTVFTEKKPTETKNTLFKLNAYPIDSGNYTCSPSNVEQTTVVVHVSSADLSVEINEVTPSPRIGNLMQLDCIASGPPSVTVKWYFNNTFVQEDERIRILPNNTLIVSDIQISHSGRYQCEARDNESEASASVTIVVKADVPEGCLDSPSFSNCELLVKANYCVNQVYRSFCCYSCTLAGYPPLKS